jgi:hypothetical protein
MNVTFQLLLLWIQSHGNILVGGSVGGSTGSEQLTGENIFLLLPGIELRSLGRVACVIVTVQTEIFQSLLKKTFLCAVLEPKTLSVRHNS